MHDGWIIYAIFGVLVCLLLWRVATQWKVKSAEAQNLRAPLIVLGVVALAFVVWQFVQQASPIAVTVASTTSTQDSGLFEYLLPIFKQKTGITVKVLPQAAKPSIQHDAALPIWCLCTPNQRKKNSSPRAKA